MIIKFLESTHQRYTRFPLDICSGYSQLLQLSSFISETVYLLTGSLESSYYSTSSVGILAYIVLTLKTFIWSHQCNRNVLQSCVVSGQLAAASQCNIKNITILHSSRMQRLLLNQAQKNLMNKLKENGTLKAVHCEIFSSWFLALVRILKMIKM